MKKLLLVLAILFSPTLALAQCNGVFPVNTACGTVGGGPPGPIPFSSIISGGGLTHTHIFVGNSSNIATDFGTKATFSDNGTLTISTPVNSLALGLITNGVGSQTGTVTADFAYNSGTITNDFLTVNSPGLYTYEQYHELDVGGGTGAKLGLRSVINLYAASTTGGDLIGLSGWCLARATNGGTNTGAGAAGTCYGSELIGHLVSGALNFLVASGGEVDCLIDTGASAAHRWCLSIVANGALHGATTDAAIEFHDVTSGGRFGNILLLRQTPVTTSGCIICADTTSVTAANFISLPNYAFSSNIFNFANFKLTGAGAITVTSGLIQGTAPILQWQNAGSTPLGFIGEGDDLITGGTSTSFAISAANQFDIGIGSRSQFRMTSGGIATTAMQVGSTALATLALGEFGFAKISASGSAPGAGFLKIAAVAGTSGGTCKIIAYAGTSTTPATVLDNIGSGC